MLTRPQRLGSEQEYYANSLLTLPSVGRSAYNNLAASIATPFVALNDLDSTYATKPEGRAMHETLDAIEMENRTPGMGWTQWGINQVASLIGYGINPIMWGFGAVGSLAARGIGLAAESVAPDAVSAFMRKPINSFLKEPLSKWIPEKIGAEGEEKALSTALIGKTTLENLGVGAGFGVPPAIVNNFNLDSNHINWGGVARDAGEMGAFGMAIGSIPFAWGVLRGKINRAKGEEPAIDVNRKKLDSALENGHITPDEHQWYVDFLEHQKNPKDVEMMESLKKRASDIINKNGLKANVASDEVQFDILQSQAVKDLQSVVPDQIVSNVHENFKNAPSDFIIHNELDRIRENPAALDGVRGFIDHTNQKLSSRAEKIAQANKILDDHLMKGVKENMPFSQKELFKYMKKAGFESSHIKNLPLTIPENLSKQIQLADKINRLSEKLKIQKKNNPKLNKKFSLERKIEELKTQVPKILTPKEELDHIRKTLITEKGLSKNWEKSNAYHRLLDLSEVWHNAKTLLDRIHLERDYAKQYSFKELASFVVNIADSNLPRLANPENVINYLKQRIEGTVFKKEPIEFAERKEFAVSDVPADADSILNDQQLQIKNSLAKDLTKEFESASERFKEFTSSENIFKNLIACVLGGLNGKG